MEKIFRDHSLSYENVEKLLKIPEYKDDTYLLMNCFSKNYYKVFEHVSEEVGENELIETFYDAREYLKKHQLQHRIDQNYVHILQNLIYLTG